MVDEDVESLQTALDINRFDVGNGVCHHGGAGRQPKFPLLRWAS